MNAKDAIRYAMQLTDQVVKGYLGDLQDEELMKRPGEGCNHIAYQLGHLISSEVSMLESICPGKAIDLPAGFAEAHSGDENANNNPSDFLRKAEYFELMDRSNAAVKAALDELTPEQLDADGPEHFRNFAPTVGDVFMLIATHPMMHAGQWVPIRRQCDKPIVM